MTDDRPDDDILDERIRALAAAQYHAPEGSVPRDAMWAQIAAARRAARAGAPTSAPVRDADVVPLAPRRRSRTVVMGWTALLAAGLVLGVVLERELFHDGTSGPTVAVAGPTSRTPAPVGTLPDSAGIDGAPYVAPSVREATPTPAPRSRDIGVAGVPRSVEQRGDTSEPRELAAVSDSTVQTLYRTAAIQTLVQAEALLTAYRSAESGSRDPQAMQQAARWARDVLSSTRLLIDSPAGRDPQMRTLFTDLELILAQIVQLSGTPLQARERELIDRAMRDRDLLPRLRSAVPAGLATS
jgi:hypothetical protein